MNLVRLLKIKELNGEFDNLSDVEKFFISQLDNLKCNLEKGEEQPFYQKPIDNLPYQL